MLYLINEQQRKKIIGDYYANVWKVVSLFLFSIFIITGILAIPAVLLLQTEVKTSTDKVSLIESEIQKSKLDSAEEEAIKITNKVHLLIGVHVSDIAKRYENIQNIVSSVSGVSITKITIDTLTKSVSIVTQVRDKEVAKDLVDMVNKTKYKGANIPYSVLSEKASFSFTQNLTYE